MDTRESTAELTAIGGMHSLSFKLPNHRPYCLEVIDLLRGLVIVIMALDHVRDFLLFGREQDPMANPTITAGLFATRGIRSSAPERLPRLLCSGRSFCFGLFRGFADDA
jgi:uncharacterized membrane protein